ALDLHVLRETRRVRRRFLELLRPERARLAIGVDAALDLLAPPVGGLGLWRRHRHVFASEDAGPIGLRERSCATRDRRTTGEDQRGREEYRTYEEERVSMHSAASTMTAAGSRPSGARGAVRSSVR